ncbi:trehalose/maltose transport system permease protein MalG [Halalkalicoccus paucihalophilus]|uniref:Trehalose/maltose transport system permease protein MalG n=1 Tax=Halalkalicoccus paucihalophilus TaxID=1008153 RepID=A0A151A9R4_9EURY|nr:carbohydrate ABC transporter permease [Halalkalicoccus paucihalophilus]KYH24421.1 trehalose/maltose transport system permease protein MalG [Halalkalicoccus paucihalophilus]
MGTDTRERSLFKRYDPQRIGELVGFYGAIILLCLVSFFPIIWIFLTSIKPSSEIVQFPVKYLPSEIIIENYRIALEQAPFARYLFNSFVVASGTAIVCVVLGSMAGYALSRLEFRFKLHVLMIVLVSAMLPFFGRLIPLFNLARETGFLNSYLGLIIPYSAFQLPFAIWIFQAYFKELPDSLEEAGLIDGLSHIGVLFRIILPVSAPAMATTAVIVFIYAWNEFLFALTFMTQDSMKTITVGIALYQGEFTFPWATISAAVFMSIVPLLLLMLFFQRKIVEGLTAGVGKA